MWAMAEKTFLQMAEFSRKNVCSKQFSGISPEILERKIHLKESNLPDRHGRHAGLECQATQICLLSAPLALNIEGFRLDDFGCHGIDLGSQLS